MMDLFDSQQLRAIDTALTDMTELYGVTFEDLQAANGEPELVDARRFLARRLWREGFRVGEIAHVLNQSHPIIGNLLRGGLSC